MKTLRACLYWADCLTEIRKIVKDVKWSVNMDDTELERDEKEGWQLPNKYYWNNNMMKIMEYGTTSHNVPAVSDGLLFAIKKTRSVFRKQKTVAEQKCIKAAGRLSF